MHYNDKPERMSAGRPSNPKAALRWERDTRRQARRGERRAAERARQELALLG